MDRIGRVAVWTLSLLLAVLWIGSLFGPLPPNDRMLAFSGLAMWLTIPWGYWVDRHRMLRSGLREEKSRGVGR